MIETQLHQPSVVRIPPKSVSSVVNKGLRERSKQQLEPLHLIKKKNFNLGYLWRPQACVI